MTIRGRASGRLGLAGLIAAVTLGHCLSASAAETTYQRLLNAPAEPQNWLMRMGSYGNWNHSALPSRPREFHPEPLTDPDLILSHHPARVIA